MPEVKDDEMFFESRPHAGHVSIKTASGEVKRLPIAVLDVPTWERYNEMADKAAKAGRVAVRIENEKKKADAEGREYIPSEADSQATNAMMTQIRDQLRFFLPALVIPDDLIGIDVVQAKQMLEFCVKKASNFTPDETADQKKTESESGTASSV